YLWYSQIPNTFNPRVYANPDSVMRAIRAYSNEPGFAKPVDRWSFGIKQADWNNLSSGVSQDFGFGVFFLVEGDLRVKYVEQNSPAGLAGVRRGWRITKINGNTNVTSSNANFIVNAVYYSNSSTFTFQKPDGSTVDVTLNAATYQENPVYLDTVYNGTNGKIGYMVFNSFLGDTTAVYNQFSQIFSNFSAQGVQDVVIDLRYNGGGYVSVSQTLANYLVTSSASGQLMMTEKFNDKYSNYNEATNFNKLGSLNLSRVFFIVSDNTASASELLINNLKPYLDVKLVGPDNTYGKPVGFFPIPVGDWYIFPVSFRSTNHNGQGNYFNGLYIDYQAADGLDKDWGDTSESCLSSVLKFINTGSFRQAARLAPVQDSRVRAANQELSAPAFKGAIGNRPRF
ncbi:MAG TPA: S41 family peptidase, partial [Chitinophagaceae bacterium]|nr:S41 family peptidase [Chitinophagaceae bacterium]